MMTDAEGAMRAVVRGPLRGRHIDGEMLVSLEEEAIVLRTANMQVALSFAELDGARHSDGALELYLGGGDAVLVRGADSAPLGRELERRILVVPELMRSLRMLGSRRAAPAPEHDRYLAPFLDACRAAERAPTLDALRAAHDAGALSAALTSRLSEIAADRYPNEPPERRALEAELLECVGGLLLRLGELERAQTALAVCDERERFARWRGWCSALHSVLQSADDCWPDVGAVLVDERRESTQRRRTSRRTGRRAQ